MTQVDFRAGHDDMEDVEPPAATSFLIGHSVGWSDLTQAENSGRLHHAWLIQGPRGIGKSTLAFAFARHLLGLRPSSIETNDAIEFDAGHPVFRQIASGGHPSLIHIRRAEAERGGGFKSQITVDEIRRLQSFFHATAANGWRVAIIDPADDLNRSAANALLKILEEPPLRSVFLIANHSPGRILPTIRSRCRVLKIAPLPEHQIQHGLKRKLPAISEEEAASASRVARGSLREALTVHLQGGADVLEAATRMYASGDPDWASVNVLADSLTQKGRETAWELLRDGLLSALAIETRQRLDAGETKSADFLAKLWQNEQSRWREASAYNLDRKQTLLTFLHNLQTVRAKMGG